MTINITTLYKEYYPKLVMYANKYLKDYQYAEEIADDTFIAIRKYIKDIENEYQLDTWLYKVVKHKCINFLEKQKVAQKTIMRPSGDYIPDYWQSFDRYSVLCEVVNEIFKEIENMPAKPKRVFELSYFEDKTLEDIAEIMHTKKQTVKNQLTFALKTLRVKFNPRSMKANEKSGHSYMAYTYA